ncbi:MAG: formate--tetrahydrofolate ligase [SAR202 cluster bacterium]|nr:formate--tetrahydrofolate ligase [SAR202 cluster bacterium]
MRPIYEIADKMGLDREAVIPYGKYKAKIDLNAIRKDGPRGKLIVMTGMTPTRAGEGKTTTTVGLTQAMGKLGHRVAATLREPSLGPIFGVKGGGTGGGAARVLPEDEINIHFTGDAHAVASAHNLLGAITDNAAQRGAIPGFSPAGMTWRRVMDIEDRALRQIITGLGGPNNAPMREAGFDIVTASEIMAILALSSGIDDLRARLTRIVVGFTEDDKPVPAGDVQAVGSMMALLRHAIHPNLVQTQEGQPVLIHAGPFGNIAHGCNSVVADRLALGYSDYVITEAGFGADLGFEKFMHIKARFNGLEPSAAVLVTTVRAVKSHGGVRLRDLEKPNEAAVRAGVVNVQHLVGVVRSFGLPVVVAINRFPTDTKEEVAIVKECSESAGAFAAVESTVYANGGAGGVELAEAVVAASKDGAVKPTYLYPADATIEEKVLTLARKVYNAADVSWNADAKARLKTYAQNGWGGLPVCMAKTNFSISDDPTRLGRPSGYTFRVSDVRASVGAGFIYPIAGTIVTMPGLPGTPRSLDIDEKGNVVGL